jgi:putative PIG3 family NAD(P)H quinone oxidoreductase
MAYLPSTMKAIAIDVPGDTSALTLVDRPIPRPGAGEVLIEVTAAGINRPDIMQRRGLYPPPPGASDIPGLEIAGRVVALGESVQGITLEDAVCALVTGGGYAEYCLAAAPLCLPIPQGLSFVEAATLPEALFTVWSNVFERCHLEPGETLLVHGGTSGIGTTAIMLATLYGARVLATAGGPEKCNACLSLGAEAIDYRQTDFRDRVMELTCGAGVDVILDIVGGPYLARHLEILAPEGRLAIIAVQGGPKTEINLLPIMLKRLTVTGSTLRPRSLIEKSRLAGMIREQVWPWVTSGQLRPVIDSTFQLEEAALAHQRMESGQHTGKIALTLEPKSC